MADKMTLGQAYSQLVNFLAALENTMPLITAETLAAAAKTVLDAAEGLAELGRMTVDARLMLAEAQAELGRVVEATTAARAEHDRAVRELNEVFVRRRADLEEQFRLAREAKRQEAVEYEETVTRQRATLETSLTELLQQVELRRGELSRVEHRVEDLVKAAGAELRQLAEGRR